MNRHVKTAFSIMRFIVAVGGSSYALGLAFGYLMAAVNDDALNVAVDANGTNVKKHVETAFSIRR